MDCVYLIGDVHTVNTFRICGIEGFAAGGEPAQVILGRLLVKRDAAVILVTREFAESLSDTIRKVNLESGGRVIIEIPGVDDIRGFGRSLTSYITEALGVAL
ncbi:MAG TPA: V-type ATP synthase subunit F [Spirochaetota bacterium]|nr:V-type ATP synthase subunit F [Spirochaetota bacterium]